MTMKATRHHLCATAIAAVIATAIATMGKALLSSVNRIQRGDGGVARATAMVAQRWRRGDVGGKGRGEAVTLMDEAGGGRRRRQRRCVGPESPFHSV